MDNISDLINRVHPLNDSSLSAKSANDSQTETCTNTKLTLSHSHIEKLWEKLAAMFGHKWTSTFGEEVDPTGVWLTCLQDLTTQQLADGLSSIARSGREWPPGAPEFRALCLPNADSLGLPTEAVAYHMLLKVTNTSGPKDWGQVHSVVYHTYMQLDPFELKIANATRHRQLFNEAYRMTVQQAAAGATFPPVPQVIEHNQQPVTGSAREKLKAEARTQMDKVRQMHNI